ncbi:MAG: hypothetical protein E7Z69_08290 [Thermoplasmata archaeon]|nr:hypothetical protein [Thermoplasmata archaeon]
MKPAAKRPNAGIAKRAPRHGEVWLADSLLFNDGMGSKSRPVVIKSREEDRFVCFKCTSQESSFRCRYMISDLMGAGLDKVSYIDYDPVIVNRGQLVQRLGALSEKDVIGFGRL